MALQPCQGLGTASAFPPPATLVEVPMASGSEAPCQGGHIQSSQKIPLSPPNSSYLA